ncbi:unnamed protein product [Allacma fusca]|uniref:Uncharacterized protein n=1 Tax=Allacma fusca TaxID=39272 RepID=A0A8J2LNQ0_9HEXA|nr:unnamed protein product [Allacma fusca]
MYHVINNIGTTSRATSKGLQQPKNSYPKKIRNPSIFRKRTGCHQGSIVGLNGILPESLMSQALVCKIIKEYIEANVLENDSVLHLTGAHNKTEKLTPGSCMRNIWFSEKIMIVRAMTGRGVLPRIKFRRNVNINLAYYVANVLKPIRVDGVAKMYGEGASFIVHQDAASSHTARYKQAYPGELKAKTGINAYSKSRNPGKVAGDYQNGLSQDQVF